MRELNKNPSYGIKGFLVLNKPYESRFDIDLSFKNIAEKVNLDSIEPGNFLTWNSSLNGIEFKGEGEYLDLMFIHALPSLNNIVKCQQPGWDMTGPVKLWLSEFLLTPRIDIPNKDNLCNDLNKGGFVGLNLGGGAFFEDKWISLDSRFGYESHPNLLPIWIETGKPLPFKSNTLDYIYTSHFLEHVDEDIYQFIIEESFRILKPNGRIHIVVPDFEKALAHYKMGSWAMVEGWGFGSRANTFSINHRELSLETLTATMFAGGGPVVAAQGSSPAARWVFANGPNVPAQELREIFLTLSPKEISNYLVNIVGEMDIVEHVNAYTYLEMVQTLSSFGFKIVDETDEGIIALHQSMPSYTNKWEFVSLNIRAVKCI